MGWMYFKARIFVWLAVLILAVIYVVYALDNKPLVRGDEAMNEKIKDKSTYPTYFADYRRSSYLPVSSAAAGEVGWWKELNLPEDIASRAVMIWEGNIVVDASDRYLVYNRDGKRLWEREKADRSPIAAGNKLLYSQNRNFFLDAVDLSNKPILDDISFPEAANEDYAVALMAPLEKAFLAVIQFKGGEDETPPAVRFHYTAYGEFISDWVHSMEGTQSLPPLFIQGIDRLIIFMKDVACYNTEGGQEVSRCDFPIDSPLIAAGDSAGNIYLLGRHEDAIVLIAMNCQGSETWRWRDDIGIGGISERQPPVIGNGGDIYIVGEKKVVIINNGKLTRTFDPVEQLPEAGDLPGFTYGTALADGSLLLAAGPLLYRVNEQGGIVFHLDMEGPITAPPVADAEGIIYVVTATDLFQVK